ncbi:MAG: Lipoate-protein ligase A subunit 1 [Methanomassiliicoccales archaeon PtaB.Bin134]|nr:MAG: Lipoate-protein ligase A subunit 1 [Methanomassiliicoccales archaeon PtaB.Bin134]
MHFRLVDSDLVSPERSAAIDEAILLARDRGSVPDTLHLYRRDRPMVSLGYFERTSTCLDKEAMERLGVRAVRRASGGSAIYTDPGQLIYSVIMDRRYVPEDPLTTFRMLCQGLVLGLEELGVRAEYKPVNDILVDGRKISGSAQMRRGSVVLQHGTLLVSVDYDRMFAVLRSSKRVRESLVSLSELIAPVPSMDTVKKAVVRGFSRALGCFIERGTLTSSEVKDVDELVATKYGRDEHTYLR